MVQRFPGSEPMEPPPGRDQEIGEDASIRSASCSTTATGSPRCRTWPPNAIEHSPNQAQPSSSPARTSVVQCTPNATRVAATATAMATAIPRAIARPNRGRPRASTNATHAQVAAAATEWPEGNDVPENPVSGAMVGRARSTEYLITLE